MGASETDTQSRLATETAKKEGQDLAQRAAESTGHVAQTAKTETAAVVREAKSEARNLAGQARTQLRTQVDDQRHRVAGMLRTSGQEISRFAGSEGQSSLTTELARRAGDYAQSLGDYLDRADTARMLDDVRSFARRRPGTFILIAVVSGVVAGRLTRSVAASQSSTSSSEQSWPATTSSAQSPPATTTVVDPGASGRGGTGLAVEEPLVVESRP